MIGDGSMVGGRNSSPRSLDAWTKFGLVTSNYVTTENPDPLSLPLILLGEKYNYGAQSRGANMFSFIIAQS
jgi:hypothetical protein